MPDKIVRFKTDDDIMWGVLDIDNRVVNVI